MEFISQNTIWETLLEVRNKVSNQTYPKQTYTLIFKKGICKAMDGMVAGSTEQKSVIISRETILTSASDSVQFVLDNNNNISQVGESFLDSSTASFLKQYLPFCFSEEIARKLKRCYTILHLAQTLDGRIATKSGHSKWVSNHENLVHAHRMRALCDATLIGKNTLINDSPSLTVRHVSGPNPVRVVISNSQCNFNLLKKNEGKILFFTSKVTKPVKGVEIITIPKISEYIFTDHVLKELYNRNIYSLYIEGGAITASQFIRDKTIDKFQIYISPRVFGSGVNSFSLPPIENVEDSLSFSNSSFRPMGNGILFEGEPSFEKN